MKTTISPKSKLGILALAFLVIILIGYGWRISSTASTKRAIGEVIALDASIAAEASQKIGVLERYWDGSPVVRDIVSKMDNIDLSACPKDFQLAYKRHVAAWATLARLKTSNEGLNGFLKMFLTAGTPAYAAADEAQKEIHDSWQEVQRLAIEYGVNLKNGN